MLLSAGIIGTATGVWLFTMLRALDQLDLVIGISYVTLLTIVGGLMINESVRAELRARRGMPATLRRPGSHNWVHGLPLKMRFKRSKIYVSAIPVWGIGFIIGFVGAIMGIGGGFLLVPMLIYFLRVPTATVIGTSMVLTLITMASATVMHAVTNHLVDAILALVLMVGGVIGAQFGVHTGHKMRPERLRLMLGLLVFAVGVRFAYELVVPPDDLYSLRHVSGRMMRAHRPRARALLVAASAAQGRAAGRVAVQCARRGDVEFRRREPGAVRHRAAGPGARTARRLRPRRHRHRPARNLAHAAQGAGGRHLRQRRLARVRARAVLSRHPHRPAGRRDRRAGDPAPAAGRHGQFHPDAAGRRRLRRHRVGRSVPHRLHAAQAPAEPLQPVRQGGDVPDADRVPRLGAGAGQCADRALRRRRQAVRRTAP